MADERGDRMRILVTGGAGFIGSHFVRYMLEKHDYEIVNLDALKYAGNLDNLRDLESHPRYRFVRADITNPDAVETAMAGVDVVVNFAAETHVDRSLLEAGSFIQTDVYGTYVLLEAARRHGIRRFHQVSTDEVYGSVVAGSSAECDLLDPRSPYSASKAGGELMVRAFHTSYGLPVVITRGSNTFGPCQYPEKVIPVFVTNAIEDQPLPLYGDGLNVRDWLYVLDHCAAIDIVMHEGAPGEIYNVGGGHELTNIALTKAILHLLGKPESLINYVADRPGHDRRYPLDCSKLHALGWQPRHDFDQALETTVRWYAENRGWWEKLKSGEYAEYYRRNYGDRLPATTI